MKWLVGALMIAIVMGWVAIMTIPAATVTVDEASLKFLPPETQGIAFIDAAGLRNSPLVQEVLNSRAMVLPPKINDFMSATGIDPRRDIDQIIIGKLGPRDGLVIARGRLDKFKIEQFLQQKGKQSDSYLGQTIYQDGNSALALLDNVVLAGRTSAVKKSIDQMQLPGSQPLRAELLAAIQTIEAGSQIWGVGEVSVKDLRGLGVRGPAPALEMLKSLQGGSYQMRVDTGIHVRGVGNFTDAESAKNLADLARGALAVAKLQVARQQPDVLPALDGIQVSNSGTTVTVRVEESGELLKKLHGLAPKRLPQVPQ